MAKKSNSMKSNLALGIALVAFLISASLVYQNVLAFMKLGEWGIADWLLFSQLIVFAISAYIAYTTIQSSKNTARERATLDTILDDNKDLALSKSKYIVINFDSNPYKFLGITEAEFKEEFEREPCTTLSELCEKETSDLTEKEAEIRGHLIQLLSRFEFYAVGINSGLLDENLFKRMHCSNVIKIWNATSPAITHIRKKNSKNTYFKDLEHLARNWEENPLKPEDIK